MLLSLSWCQSFAQLNESDNATFQFRASLTGNYQQGNVEVLNIKSKLDLTQKMLNSWIFKTQNSSLYQAFYEKKVDNDIYSRNYLYYQPENKIYPFAIGYISSNFRRKISKRYFIGAGLTWQLIHGENHVLKIAASAVFESTKFRDTVFNFQEYNGNTNINNWRGTLYLGGWSYLLDKRIRCYYDAYWQPALNNKNNYRIQVDLGADFPIWKGLSLNALYTFTHENVVIDKIKPEDKILTFGLAYNLKVK